MRSWKRITASVLMLYVGLLAATAAQAQTHASVGEYMIGQRMRNCPAGTLITPHDVPGDMACTLNERSPQVFGQTPLNVILAVRSNEIAAIVAAGLRSPDAALAQVTRQYGNPDRTSDLGPAGKIHEWIRDDDRIALSPSPEDKAVAILIIENLNGAKARNAAQELSSQADECLLDVRDRRIAYNQSDSCKACQALHLAYVQVDQYSLWKDTSKVPKHAMVVAEARAVLWNAVALSNARLGTKIVALW